MTYTVIKIEEDLDFGCEERPEGTPIMAVVTLKEENGNQIIRKFPDCELEQEQIQPEDRVVIDEQGRLCKALENNEEQNGNRCQERG